MMKAAVRSGALLALLVLSSACTELTPTAPTSTADSTATPPPTSSPAPGAVSFPAVSRPARIYVAVALPWYPMHGSPLASRYVLYDDGTFGLQYSSANYPFFEYRGRYAEANGHITFEWEGWSVAGPWGAAGSLTEDSLTVRYNLIMQLSDFEDGVYLRTR
jgi:hypothetical protein